VEFQIWSTPIASSLSVTLKTSAINRTCRSERAGRGGIPEGGPFASEISVQKALDSPPAGAS
jgi:hypothetical protein